MPENDPRSTTTTPDPRHIPDPPPAGARGSALCTPAAGRNKGPIAEVLARILPAHGTVLEVASGAGEHIAHFAATFSGLQWQPSEADPRAVGSIRAWRAHAGLPNLRPPLVLDVSQTPWPVEPVAAVVCINLTHIAPWPTTVALMRGASAALGREGPLLVYGPFDVQGRHTSESNARFHRWLVAQNPAWGLRDVLRVAEAARAQGLHLEQTVPMPANNLTLVLRKL